MSVGLIHGGLIACRTTSDRDGRIVVVSGYDNDGDFMLYLEPDEAVRLIIELQEVVFDALAVKP